MDKILQKMARLKYKIEEFINSNRESISIILKDNFNRDVLDRLRKGNVIISETLMKLHMEREVSKEKDIELVDVFCTPEGLQVVLLVERFLAKVKVKFCICIKNIKITSRRQMIIFSLKNEKVIGDNVSGMIISAFTETLLAGIITKSIFPEDILKSIHYKSNHTAAVVDLKDVDFIKTLNKPLFKTSKTLLDFVSVTGAKHTYKGIKLKLKTISLLC
jgi:hypothetical protein